MESSFAQFGIAGALLSILVLYIKNGFKQHELMITRFDLLLKLINKLVSEDEKQTIIYNNTMTEVRSNHTEKVKLLKDIRELLEGVNIRTELCPNINKLIDELNLSVLKKIQEDVTNG